VFHIKRWRRRLYRRVIRLQGSAIALARGAGLGSLFGCLMPPGLQLVTGIPVALLLGGNVITFTLGTLVSNPVTYVPLYIFTCKVGELFLRMFDPSVNLGQNVRHVVKTIVEFDAWHPVDMFTNIAEAMAPVLNCWIAGGLIVGLACSVPSYYFTYLFVSQVRKLRDARRAHRAEQHRQHQAAEPTASEPDEEAPDELPPPPPA
jgi:uncharacterized protein (DUF2062 family)